MLNFTSELNEFTAESKFTWTVKNFKNIDWMRRSYVIKSEEIEFKQANARWFLKLVPFTYNENKLVLISKFCVTQKPDECGGYTFEIIMKDGSVISSSLTGRKLDYFEHEMETYIMLKDEDSIEITPRVTFHTLKHQLELPKLELVKVPEIPQAEAIAAPESSEQEDDFDHLSDAEKDVKEQECFCEKCLESDEEIVNGEEGAGKSIGAEKKKNDEKKNVEISKMDDFQLAKTITNIYIGNMRQVAETSAALLISAARNDHKGLLDELSGSFAAQINLKNFTQIWKIALKLKIESLRKSVIQFVIANRDKVRYDGQIPSELMLQVVRAYE